MELTNNVIEEQLTDPKTGITIVPSRDKRMAEFAKKLILDYYLKDNESIQEGFARAAFAWSGNKPELAQRLYDAVSKGWFMFASPVLSNAPEVLNKDEFTFKPQKALPISCYLSHVDDSLDGLISNSSETRWLSVKGGGVGINFSQVRAESKMSPGPIPFICTYDTDVEAYKQGKVRRGSIAIYMDVSHPNINEFIKLRVPTGDASRKCHSTGFHNAVNITDAFMEAVENDLPWNLIDPNDRTVRDTVSARKLWDEILDIRYRTGEPYLHFIDTANKYLPLAQKNLNLKINNSNLCLTGDTIITIMVDGKEEKLRMDDFNEKYTMGYFNKVLVKSYDIDNNKIVWEEIIASGQTGIVDELYEIESEDGKHIIKCTGDHKIYTKNRGYVEAKNLIETDELVFS
ncbi:MAG: ribonucleotide-diphosphate reductase subunit [Caudoviricetes sp.]|nr:MAG: ribonucleotide-diphosphate reductase subunit [Caudoviricetes sp.]